MSTRRIVAGEAGARDGQADAEAGRAMRDDPATTEGPDGYLLFEDMEDIRAYWSAYVDGYQGVEVAR